MKCTKCGAECGDEVKFCTQCGAPLDSEGQETKAETAGETAAETAEETSGETEIVEEIAGETVAETAGETAAQGAGSEQALAAEDQPPAVEDQTVQPAVTQPVQTSAGEPGPNKKFMKILFAVIAIVFVAAAAALAYVKMTAKDPKQVVIDAFENIYKDGQVFPSEELFGFKDFADTALKEDRESGMTLKMDSCSDPSVNAFAGSGLRLEGREDRTNNRNAFNMGVIYNGMDLANFDAYYGDDTLMMAIPELSSKVFTVDLGEGLADRIKNSPTIGPMLADSGVDVDGLAGYFTDLIDEVEKAEEEGKAPFDIEALMNRYKEGCKAQDNFKAALTVTKADKGTYTMNGAQVSCQGYDVVISKDSMIEFLRTSSDFFLQDETLKGDYLKQLEATVRMSELMGGAVTGAGSVSAQEMQEQTYDEVKETVDEMITYLEKSLTDVQMTVYVDKSGNLAAVDGSTNLYVEDEPGVEDGYVAVNFKLELQGGAYLTQNLTGSVVLEDATDTVTVDLLKQGTYDGKKLTCDLSVDIGLPEDANYNFMYTGTYDSADGSYHAGVEVGGEGSQILKMSATGVMDQLEKGKNFHMDIDSLEIAAMDNTMNVVLSGEVYSRPLSSEVTPLEGEPLDVLAATEQDWNNVLMEMVFGVMGLAGQLDVPMY